MTEELRSSLLAWVRPRVRPEADAEDVVQDVFERLVRRGTDDLVDVRAFLWRASRNAVIDHQRRSAGRASAPAAVESEMPEEEPENEGRELLTACMRLFVERLPEPYREALELTDLGGLRQAEAAERAGISVSGMKSRVQRGRALVKADLLRCCAIAVDARGRPVSAIPRIQQPRCDGSC